MIGSMMIRYVLMLSCLIASSSLSAMDAQNDAGSNQAKNLRVEDGTDRKKEADIIAAISNLNAQLKNTTDDQEQANIKKEREKLKIALCELMIKK
jgi:hypothetical protein